VTNATAFRDHFLGWQCRIRQIAMRQDGGRPSAGMRPRVLTLAGSELSAALTILIVPKEPEESTAFFRFQVQKSQDARDVYERGLAHLQAEYFQQPKSFSDRLSAALPSGSRTAAAMLAEKTCVLEFNQFGQFYRLACAVSELAADDPARQATLWHNRLFNPALPDDTLVLSFRPDWSASEARPGLSTTV
jgi:hypothetical protein